MSQKLTRVSVTAAVALSSFIGALMLSALNVALPMIQREFAISAITLTWITTSFILSAAVFLVIVGKIADIIGRKRIFLIGNVLFVISTIAAGFSGSASSLIIFRVIQGIGAAMINATAMAIISSVYPPNKRGMAIGIGTAAVYTGLSFGPFLGGLLSAALGWRSILYFVTPFSLIPFLLTICAVKEEWADAKGESYDFLGSIVYAISLSLFMYGITLLPHIRALWCILPGLFGLILFIRRELTIEFPVFDVSLFRHNRVFAFSSAAALIHYSATFAIAFLLSLYLQIGLELSPQVTGLILATQPLTQAGLSPIAGRLSDRIEPAALVSSGMGVTALGLVLLSFISPGTRIPYIIAVLFLLGAGYAFFSSPNTNAIMSSVEKKHYGLASGTVATMRSLGQVLSMCVISIVISIFIGTRAIGPETLEPFGHSTKVSFIILAAFCAVGVYFSAVRGNLDRETVGSQPTSPEQID